MFCVVLKICFFSDVAYSLGRRTDDLSTFLQSSSAFLRTAFTEPGLQTLLSNPETRRAYTNLQSHLDGIEKEQKPHQGTNRK